MPKGSWPPGQYDAQLHTLTLGRSSSELRGPDKGQCGYSVTRKTEEAKYATCRAFQQTTRSNCAGGGIRTRMPEGERF